MAQIRVDEKVHKQVTKIAKANYRGIGDQISYWADNECTHPKDKRVYAEIEIPTKTDETVITEQGERRHIIGFYCEDCRTFITLTSTLLPIEAQAAAKPVKA